MQRSFRRSGARIVLGCVATLLASACVEAEKPGVSVSKFQADIVFAAKANEPALPANVSPVIGDDAAFPDDFPLGPLLDDTSGVTGICPEALLEAFPKKAASVTITGMPKPGSYKFKRLVRITTGDKTETREGFEQHLVRNVARQNDHQFTFEVVQPDQLSSEIVVSFFKVNTNPQLLVPRRRVGGQTIGVVDIPSYDVVLTNPADEPGIFLTKIERQTPDQVTVSAFQPLLPLKYLPLDGGQLTQGAVWNSLGIDPVNGTVVLMQGEVLRASRVDACGEIVEGFTVNATQTFSNALDSPVSYAYIIATQYGGLFISEVTSQRSAASALSIDTSLAALEPAPLPAARP